MYHRVSIPLSSPGKHVMPRTTNHGSASSVTMHLNPSSSVPTVHFDFRCSICSSNPHPTSAWSGTSLRAAAHAFVGWVSVSVIPPWPLAGAYGLNPAGLYFSGFHFSSRFSTALTHTTNHSLAQVLQSFLLAIALRGDTWRDTQVVKPLGKLLEVINSLQAAVAKTISVNLKLPYGAVAIYV